MGDWIYYDQTDVPDAHVGIVTAVEGNTIATVEGSVDSTVKTYSFDYTNIDRDYIVMGFASPDWTQ